MAPGAPAAVAPRFEASDPAAMGLPRAYAVTAASTPKRKLRATSSVAWLLWSQLRSPLTLLLLGASAISIAVGETTDALVIRGIVLLGAGLSFTGTLTEGHARIEAALDARGLRDERVPRLATINAAFETGLANPIDAALRAVGVDLAGVSKLDEAPYDFLRERMSVLVDDGGVVRLITKGSA